MLTILALTVFLNLIFPASGLPDCNRVVQAKLGRNPQAWIWRQPGHVTEIRDNVPYGTDCREADK